MSTAVTTPTGIVDYGTTTKISGGLILAGVAVVALLVWMKFRK